GPGEDAFDGHRVGRRAGQPLVDLGLQRQQALGRVVPHGRPHDTDLDQAQTPTRQALDHTQPAPREAGVDTEHAHGLTSGLVGRVWTDVRTRDGTRAQGPAAADTLRKADPCGVPGPVRGTGRVAGRSVLLELGEDLVGDV